MQLHTFDMLNDGSIHAPNYTFYCGVFGSVSSYLPPLMHDLRKSNFTSASLSAEALRSVETGLSDSVAQPAPTERTTNASMGKITYVSSSNHLVKTCSRWVKRLQHKHSETLSPGTKRFKKCDFPSSDMQNMYSSRMQNYYKMSHDVNRCMEEQKIEKTMAFSENGSSSLCEIEEVLQSWIRRWRCNGHQICPAASRPIAPVPSKPSEKLEGIKFASVEAMALMGKAINNCRTCRIQRREAFLEWTC